MSGGHFDYKCFQIRDFAEELSADIEQNSEGYAPETLEVLQQCQTLITQAAEVARAVEWLYSGDTGEETFLERIKEKLNGATP